MHLLLVNLYEFGLFLRILLWISVPLIVVTLLVTIWLHYRSRRKDGDELRFSMEGMDITAEPADLLAAIQGRRMSVGIEEAGSSEGPTGGEEREDEFSERERNRMYKGILWMKEKYEQYRDLADQRIEQLKNELVRSEQRYQDLLDQRMEEPTPDRVGRPATDGVGHAAAGSDDDPSTDGVEHPAAGSDDDPSTDGVEHPAAGKVEDTAPAAIAHHSPDVMDDRERLLEEKGRQLNEKDHQLASKDRQIEELQEQLQRQWQQTEALVSKLQNSSQLLLKISRELDGSVPPANQPQPDPQAQAEAQPS